MKQLLIPCEPGEVSDGYHTFNELYEHRNTLFLALMKCRLELAWLSAKHNDGSEYPGWFIAGLDLPTGTVTYHMPNGLMGAAVNTGARVLEVGKPWDGHTPGDVLVRLRDWIGTAGPDNPAIERFLAVPAEREAIEAAHAALKEMRNYYLETTGLPPCAANAAIAKLQPFILPTEDKGIQEFVAGAAKDCTADDKPCDACLAGGVCDGPSRQEGGGV